MKLIIDIQDDTYKTIKEMMYFYSRSGRKETYEIANSIKAGIPLEEELEKIKADIIKFRDDDKNDLDFEIGAINSIIAIVDKYIKEIKNETNN